uniref:Pol polyprotein n=1 Tax=Tanacetum cinerariifolium TaxID=118510 RepID=A0A6L2N3S9_TANCI|nr:Pol polyprotein [Tanacetum cinerariifolium]
MNMFFELLEFKFKKNGKMYGNVCRSIKTYSNTVLFNEASVVNLDRNIVLILIGSRGLEEVVRGSGEPRGLEEVTRGSVEQLKKGIVEEVMDEELDQSVENVAQRGLFGNKSDELNRIGGKRVEDFPSIAKEQAFISAIMDFGAMLGSVPLNSCELARRTNTNAALRKQKLQYHTQQPINSSFPAVLLIRITRPFRNLSGKLSSLAVQQLWTLYPGKQTANLMTNNQTPSLATTVVNPTGAPITNTVANHAERPKKFNGQNFKRWQQKMFFYLITLGLAQFLKETVPQVEPPAEGQSSNAQAVQAVEAWKHLDFLCHNYVLNGLIDPLYNVYYKTTTTKELWESLERNQVQDLHVLIHDIHAEGMTLSETFQVAAIIEKLPPSWVDFRNYVKHKRKEMSVEDLVVRLRIEEDNRLAQKETYTPDSAKTNMIEHAGSSSRSNLKGKGKDKRKNDKKSKGKSEYLAPKAGIRVNPRQANMVNDDVDMIAMVSDVCAMIYEVNLVGTNHGGWWIDTGATRHVCVDKSMFHSFKAVDNGQKLYLGNSATADIKGEGDVVLKMTSEKELKLNNVLYVLVIRKNLVSGWLLNKFGFRLVFESDKFVLSKNQIFVGKGYAMNGMFKLNVMVVKNEINKMNSSAYLIESSNVWHGRLGHVNFNLMRHLIKFNSIPNFHIYFKYKCKTCVETKLTRTSVKLVKRKTKPLDMVHTDICDLKSLPTKGGNKYFIMFIDDCTKYCYVYLLKSKDEAIDKFVLYKTEVENQLGKKIKVVRSDRGCEYMSPFTELCAKHGIRHEFTAPYSPQQNAKLAVPTPKTQKIRPKSVDCMFIGYARNNSAYRFIVHESKNPDIQKNTVMESRNASFFEHIFPYLSKETGSSSRLDDEVVQDKRQRDDNDLQDERQDQTEEEEVEPRRSKRARSMERSYQTMILAIAVLRNLEVHQMDVKTAFLNVDLEEEIYMNQPEGFIAPGQKDKVCTLVKSLYGLKQAPKQWHQNFDHAMLESGFKINECDKCVYVKDTSSGYVILCLYVDDMLIIGSNDKMIKSTKGMLKSKFDIKDMGLADVILGIKIIRTQNGLVLSQAHYVDKIRVTHNARDSGLARTPIDTNLHLSKNRGVGVAQLEYSKIIGMLMYLMTSTRTDLAYVVSGLKFIALDKCKEEAEWLHQFVEDIPRHIRRRHNWIRKLLSTGVISIDYVASKDNIADPFTKGLSRELVSKSSKGMGLKPLKEWVSMKENLTQLIGDPNIWD